ncbi:MAG TPA: hypothetical protein VF615_27155 [Longimicrobiaceae bacterium]|jgi:hypothetical protein
MSRSFINLRRALFGVSCTIVFGFGATQALATPYPPMVPGCDPSSLNDYVMCDDWCVRNYGTGGSCSEETNHCLCYI